MIKLVRDIVDINQWYNFYKNSVKNCNCESGNKTGLKNDRNMDGRTHGRTPVISMTINLS